MTRTEQLLSVIVPVYNQWHRIPNLLAALAAQTVGQNAFQVILVDNGSTDVRVPQPLARNVMVTHCSQPGSYAARNAGAALAEGRWLVFTDADCEPEPDWLEQLLPTPIRDQRVLVAGHIKMVASTPTPSSAEIYDLVKGIPQAHYVRQGYGATANLAIPRHIFDQLGGFNPLRFSGGDAEFCRRAGRAGVSLIYRARAAVRHPARTRWEEISIKARRVKGGQLLHGTRQQRLIWVLRTLTPPLRAYVSFMRNTRHPLSHRFKAVTLQTAVWGVELREAIRLLTWPAERR